MENNGYQPLAVPYPNDSRSSLYQHSGSRGEIYPVQDHSAEHLIPRRNPARQDSSQHRQSDFSIPRKPIGSSSALPSSEDSNEKGPYDHVDTVGTRRKNQKGGQFEFLGIWWLELLCCVLFVGALVAVIVTIRPYEGRPLPQWPYHLTINTLISVYIVILKAAMLLVAAEGLSQLKWTWFGQYRPLKDLKSFDDASRGPWGSLTLMWRLRGPQFVSRCGAFITVAALIIDPFAQQVISTYDCDIPVESGRATIPRTNNFSERGKHIGAAIGTVSLEMQRSINAGIFNPGGNVAFNCPTGNCTFPSEYHTVAYCSECNDTTNRLVINAETSASNMSSWTISLNDDDAATMSNLSVVMNSSSSTLQYLAMKSTMSGNTDIVAGYLSINQSSVCADTCPSIAEENTEQCNANWNDIVWGCAALTGQGSGSLNSSQGVGAASCSLFPCVRTYTAEVRDGEFKETLRSVAKEWNYVRNSIDLSAMVNVKCLNAQDRRSLIDAGYEIEGKSWVPYNITVDGVSGNYSTGSDVESSNGTVSRECIYQHGATAAHSIGYFLASFLNGTITPGLYSYDFTGSAQLQALYNEANLTFNRIDETWSNLSDSITTYMRQHGGVNLSAPARGEALRLQTCVHIRWPFLAYPAALVLLAIIFFISMIIETRGAETSRHDWKSSPLALLFHGLDRDSIMNRDEIAESVRAREMSKIAEHTPVRLSQTEHGWQFVRN
jgi:Protein of unknown function (DUF3176)